MAGQPRYDGLQTQTMTTKKPKRRGPQPEILKVEGDIGRVLDKLLGKYGPPPSVKQKTKKTGRRRKA